MSTVNQNPSGFSYAQAAKRRAPSGVMAQAAPVPATLSATTPSEADVHTSNTSSNWAEDSEATNQLKVKDMSRSASEHTRNSNSSKDIGSDGAAQEPKRHDASNAYTSDLTILSSIPTKNDEVMTPPVTSSSHTAGDGKPSTTEPAWIAERKERQTSFPGSDVAIRADKDDHDAIAAPLKPVSLHEAPPPSVNPWLKRAEESKARVASQGQSLPPTPPAERTLESSVGSLRNKTDFAKSNPTPSSSRDDETSIALNGERKPKSTTGYTPSSSNLRAAVPGQTSSTKQLVAPPPPVKNDSFWPTPENAAEKERRDASDKDAADKQVDDSSHGPLKPKKKEWQSMVVTPNIIFETQGIRGREGPRNSERGGRGGPRTRGGARAAATGVNGERTGRTKDDDGTAQRGNFITSESESANTAAQAKQSRASSTNTWAEASKDSRFDRNLRSQPLAENRAPKKTASGPPRSNAEDSNQSATDARHTKSPRQTDGLAENKQDEFAARSNPRPTPSNSRPDEMATETAVDGQSARAITSDSRKEQNSFREHAFGSSGRGGKRGGRGRGGAREFTNGHQGNASYTNGNEGEGLTNGTSGGSISPHPNGRSNHHLPTSHHGRAGWRGNPRSQSIPLEGYYNRFPTYNSAGPLPPVQTYMPGMYDFSGVPMTAMPYPPVVDNQYLAEMVNTQLEYYFSIDNLLKDMFLRKNMDSQGFVFFDVIANFNRIKQLTQDKDLLRLVCVNSENIEIRVGEDGKERLRRREGWERFLLPVEQRDAGAQNDGPKQLRRPERPQLQVYGLPPFRGPASAAPYGPPHRGDRRSHDVGLPVGNGFTPAFGTFAFNPEGMYGETNGDDIRGRSAKSPSHENGTPGAMTPGAHSEEDRNEPDAFPDHQADVLTVVVKVNHQRVPHHNAASRTFSNGSIDTRGIFTEIDPASAKAPAPSKLNGELTARTEDESQGSRASSPNKKTQSTGPLGTSDPDISLFWMKDQTLPSEDLPSDVTLEPYVVLRQKALDQRGQAATGTCPYDLDVLYQFWCHFLIRNFNSRMYGEFKFFAKQDAEERNNVAGLLNLVKFYSQALLSHNPIRYKLVQDYVDLVNDEPPKLENAAFKQLRSAWRNGALHLKNRKRLTDIIDPALKERLGT